MQDLTLPPLLNDSVLVWRIGKQSARLAALRNLAIYRKRVFDLPGHNYREITMTDVAFTPTQSFTVSHVDEADFKVGGLRSYSAYRDLGIAAATNGDRRCIALLSASCAASATWLAKPANGRDYLLMSTDR